MSDRILSAAEVEAVRGQHDKAQMDDGDTCRECRYEDWPCATVRLASSHEALRERVETAEASLIEMRKQLEAMDMDELRAALSGLRREHLNLEEDCWFSCPKSGHCCTDNFDEANPPCRCGADEYNARIDAALAGEGRSQCDDPTA